MLRERDTSMRKSSIILLASLTVTGCGHSPPPKTAAPSAVTHVVSSANEAPNAQAAALEPDRSQEDAIREVVIRDLLKKADSREIFFLMFDRDTDPSAPFLARFADLKLRIRKRSDAHGVKSTDDDHQFWFDRSTGQPGSLVGATELRWIDQSQVEVEGVSYTGKLNASGFLYVIENKDGKWVVVKKEGAWEA
jgi:hypothetical protein